MWWARLEPWTDVNCFATYMPSQSFKMRLNVKSFLTENEFYELENKKSFSYQWLCSSLALRWLNTVLRVVSGNLRDGTYVLNGTNKHGGKKVIMVHRRQFLQIYSLTFCNIWQNLYFYCILNNENFQMEVEQTNFVTHFNTVQ